MRHVEKGCLVRNNQTFSSDGSRIEGSHKGWNSIQRSFASGIEVFTALCHDFVLRRNVRVVSSHDVAPPFLKAAHGSHHLGCVNHVNSLWNALVRKDKTGKMKELPELPDVQSHETFGLVTSRHVETFSSLVKCKGKQDGDESLSVLDEQDDEEILLALKIDPKLRFQPACPTNQVGPSLMLALSDPGLQPIVATLREHHDEPEVSTVTDMKSGRTRTHTAL
jgi:hypothetical protein